MDFRRLLPEALRIGLNVNGSSSVQDHDEVDAKQSPNTISSEVDPTSHASSSTTGAAATNHGPGFKAPLIESSSCSICMEPFDKATEAPVVLKCGHTFGHKCIGLWLQQHGGAESCPECRSDPYFRAEASGSAITHPILIPDDSDVSSMDGDELDDSDFSSADEEEPLTPVDERPLAVAEPPFMAWSRLSNRPGSWRMKIGSRFETSDLSQALETLLFIIICSLPTEELATGLEEEYQMTMDFAWHQLKSYLRFESRENGNNSPFGALLRKLPASRARSQDQQMLQINQTKTVMRVAIMRTSYINADFAERINLYEWVTQQVHPFVIPNHGLQFQAGVLLRNMRSRLDGFYAALGDDEEGQVDGEDGPYPFKADLLSAVGPRPLQLDLESMEMR